MNRQTIILILCLVSVQAIATDRVNLVQAGEWGSKITYDIWEDGNRMAVLAGDELRFFEIDSNGDGTQIGTIHLPSSHKLVSLSGNYAAIVSSADQISILDISNVNAYAPLSSLPPVIEEISDCLLSDQFLYVAVGPQSYGALRIYSMANPESPKYIGATKVGTTSSGHDEMVTGMAKSGDIVYISGTGLDSNSYTYYSATLWAVDVADPTAPNVIGKFQKQSRYCSSGLAITGTTAVMGLYYGDQGYVACVDVSDPEHMTELGETEIELLPHENPVAGITARNGMAIVGLGKGGIQQVDISDPADPKARVHCEQNGYVSCLSWAGSHPYVVNVNEGVFRLENPMNSGIALTPFLEDHTLTGLVHDIAARGNIMLVAQNMAGVRIVDVSDYASPAELSHIFPDSRASRLALDDETGAVVCKEDTAIRLFDLSDLSSPVALGTTYFDSFATDLDMGNGFLLACSYGNCHVYDVLDPAHPALLETIDTNFRTSTSISGTYAAVVGSSKIQILDLSTPGEASVLSFLEVSSQWRESVAFNGTHIYVSNLTTGHVAIYNWTYPDQIQCAGAIPILDCTPGALLIDNSLLYVNTGSSGIEVYDIHEPAIPVKIGTSDTPTSFYSIAAGQNGLFGTAIYKGSVLLFNKLVSSGSDLFTLTTNLSDGNGTVEPYGTSTYESGTIASVTASPEPGNTFSQWTGDVTGSENPLTIAMNEDKTIQAVFQTSNDHTAPETPDRLYVHSASPEHVKIRFRASTDAEGGTGVWRYHIYRRDLDPAEHNFALQYKELGTTLTTAFVDRTTPDNQTVIYSVRAEDYAGNLSNESEFVRLDLPAVDTTSPSAIAGLQATPVGGEAASVHLDWLLAGDDESGVSVYEVFRQGTIPESEQQAFAITFSTGWTDNNVENGETYTYWVRSRDLAGNVSTPVSIQATVPVLSPPEEMHTVYFPHLASGIGWWTGFALVNTSDTVANIQFDFFDAGGTLVETLSDPSTLEPGEKILTTIANLFDDGNPDTENDVPEGAAWWRVVSDQPIEGFELFGRPSNDETTDEMVGVKIAKTASSRLLFPVVRVSEAEWTGLALVNTSPASTASVIYKAYSETGDLLATSGPVTIPPFGKTVRLAESYFDSGTLPAGTTKLIMEGDQPCIGFELFGYKDQTGLAGISAVTLSDETGPSASVNVQTTRDDKAIEYPFRYRIPRINVTETETAYCQLTNVQDEHVDLVIQYTYEDGSRISEESTIFSMGSKTISVHPESVYGLLVNVDVRSTDELTVCEIFEDITKGYMDCLFAMSDGRHTLDITHVATQTSYWDSSIYLWNPTPYYNYVKIHVYGPDGSLLNLNLSRRSNPFTMTVKPFQAWEGEIHELISADPNVQQIGWITVEGQFSINGHFTFGTRDGSKLSAIELGAQ